ncbi:putative membrane protein YagU involved in acid resistance [Arthrobacter sp. CAN_A214]|uniref:DUF1440 domain-containing protein n=1 Tax=Arthrobacter sp. CAN_A214 TaxID=2787720 RepID=UPI0018C9A1C3
MEPERNIALDLVLGAAAGAVGVWVMDHVGSYMYDHEDRDALARELQARTGGSDVEYTGPEKEALDRTPHAQPAGKDVAHVGVEKAAEMTGINMSTAQPNSSGVALHYALGILPGALHAVIRREAPFMKAGSGALYGFGLYVLNDEIVAPALGLASGPQEYPWQAHARGMVAHTVLGVVTESLLRISDRAR